MGRKIQGFEHLEGDVKPGLLGGQAGHHGLFDFLGDVDPCRLGFFLVFLDRGCGGGGQEGQDDSRQKHGNDEFFHCERPPVEKLY